MLTKPTPSWIKQSLILGTFGFLCVAPQMVVRGLNIVTLTYAGAAHRFWQGLSPYLPPPAGADWFKYSPFFAMAYGPIGFLPGVAQSLAWAFLNAMVFWIGVSRWFSWSKSRPWWFWAALILCSMEMDGSLRYQQVNALLIGLVLISLACHRDQKLFSSAAWLILATNIKVLPGIFLLPLALRFERRFWLGMFAAGAATFLLPMLIVGPSQSVAFHFQWLELLQKDIRNTGIVDIASLLMRYGWEHPKPWTTWPILVLSTGLMLWQVPPKKIPWAIWITLGVTCQLLTNPRTESPTFVLAGPLYLFLAAYFSGLGKKGKVLGFTVLFAAAFFITLSFNDIWPKALWNPHSLRYASKTFGVLALWMVGLVCYLHEVRRSHRV